MRIGIFGASGLIGTGLRDYWKNKHEVIAISSEVLYGPEKQIIQFTDDLDVVVNLAGYPIAGRWNKNRKNLIYNSRVLTTGNLVRSFKGRIGKPLHLINASAIGIYNDGRLVTEGSEWFNDNFLAKVVKDWEKEAFSAAKYDVKVTVIRMGVVLSKKGGAYIKLRRIVNSGLGGRIASGKQGFSFVLLGDLVRIIDFIIDREIIGIVNAVSPEPVNNKFFIGKLAAILNRPAFLIIPGFILRVVLGEGSCILLEGQKVLPEKLLTAGFAFQAQNLDQTLISLEKSL